MEATETLMQEHRVIERVLAALNQASGALESGKDVRPGFFGDAADFISGFADGCHHKKEEGVLFKSLIDHGMPAYGGPIAVMLAEHEQGRAYTRGMRAAAAALAAGDQSAKAKLLANARGYTALLAQHIAKEDQVLFPMADRVIPPADQPAVTDGFEHVEHEETGEGIHEKYLALAQSLEAEAAGLA